MSLGTGAAGPSVRQASPIFVHASPRSGSTYFFNVLRRNASLMCFNEAIADVFSYYGKRDIGRYRELQGWNVNHEFLERADFAEFVDAWDDVMHLYPRFPTYDGYLPPNGVLPAKLRAYLAGLIEYALARGKRPALCEIHSRGRAGALRDAFAGYHIAQYRDPLSQFGSFLRPVLEAGRWNFLTFPLKELGISGDHPLYRLVPEAWRVPVLPWPSGNRTQRWSAAVQYVAMVASPRPGTMEKALRWHLFAWVLNNLAAVCYSDLALDIDRLHDDAGYRASVTAELAVETGAALDLGDIATFSRYIEFEGLDTAKICGEVAAAAKAAAGDGRMTGAVRTLAQGPPRVPAGAALDLLLTKLDGSLTAMQATPDRRRITAAEWSAVAEKYRMVWFNAPLRAVAERILPFAQPLISTARRAGIWR